MEVYNFSSETLARSQILNGSQIVPVDFSFSFFSFFFLSLIATFYCTSCFKESYLARCN